MGVAWKYIYEESARACVLELGLRDDLPNPLLLVFLARPGAAGRTRRE